MDEDPDMLCALLAVVNFADAETERLSNQRR